MRSVVKKIPDAISFLRIGFAVALCFTHTFSVCFYFLYLACGISDIADGFFARKLSVETRFGAVLDSIGDILFFAVAIVKVLLIIKIPTCIFIWILAIAVIKFTSFGVGYKKYKKPAFLHTYFNKITGLAVFSFPLLYQILNQQILYFLLCTIASLAATEELIINISSNTLELNQKGLFIKR